MGDSPRSHVANTIYTREVHEYWSFGFLRNKFHFYSIWVSAVDLPRFSSYCKNPKLVARFTNLIGNFRIEWHPKISTQKTNSDWHCRRLFHLLPSLWLLLKWSSLRTFSYVILILLLVSTAASCYLIMCYCWIERKFLDRFNVILSSSFPNFKHAHLVFAKMPRLLFSSGILQFSSIAPQSLGCQWSSLVFHVHQDMGLHATVLKMA